MVQLCNNESQHGHARAHRTRYQAGQAAPREKGKDVVIAGVQFDSTTRPVIDGHKLGFRRLIADDTSSASAVDIAEVAAITIAAGMRVEELARIPLAYPT
jgi:pyruvate/2-oxoglutarate dehydrogenase complex dihydrolipoamide dehydrogenase (E3) component